MIIVTVDIDWASEVAIAETLDFLQSKQIRPTVFVTHASDYVKSHMDTLDVGLHPFFDPVSSHGSTINAVVRTIFSLPYNVPIFRCHRFAVSNAALSAMQKAGMQLSSNVCTDLETLSPFKQRTGLIEIPIFLEDGGYLWRNHPLKTQHIDQLIQTPTPQIIIIHPMHFILNSPSLNFMKKIKASLTRSEWNSLSKKDLDSMRWNGWGIRNFLIELINQAPKIGSLVDSLAYSPSTRAIMAKLNRLNATQLSKSS